MLNGGDPQAGQHGDSRAVVSVRGVDSVLARTGGRSPAPVETLPVMRQEVKRVQGAPPRHWVQRNS